MRCRRPRHRAHRPDARGRPRSGPSPSLLDAAARRFVREEVADRLVTTARARAPGSRPRAGVRVAAPTRGAARPARSSARHPHGRGGARRRRAAPTPSTRSSRVATTARSGCTAMARRPPSCASTVVPTPSVAARVERGGLAAEPDLRSPMPGTVTAVFAADGDTVAQGDAIVAIEAMKMEHRVVAASVDGIVRLSVAVERPRESRPGGRTASSRTHPEASEPRVLSTALTRAPYRRTRPTGNRTHPPGMRSTPEHDLTPEQQQLSTRCATSPTPSSPRGVQVRHVRELP